MLLKISGDAPEKLFFFFHKGRQSEQATEGAGCVRLTGLDWTDGGSVYWALLTNDQPCSDLSVYKRALPLSSVFSSCL